MLYLSLTAVRPRGGCVICACAWTRPPVCLLSLLSAVDSLRMRARQRKRARATPTLLRGALLTCLALEHTIVAAQELQAVCEDCSNIPAGQYGPPCESESKPHTCEQYFSGGICFYGTVDPTHCGESTSSPCWDPASGDCWPYVNGTGVKPIETY